MSSLMIQGVDVEIDPDMTVLDAARKAGIEIPTLCFLRGCSAIGACRVCVVEVEQVDHPVAACTTIARDGMVVVTESETLTRYRRMALELLVSDVESHRACSDGELDVRDENEFQALCRQYGVSMPHYPASPLAEPLPAGNPFLSYDPKRCILCQRCVGACGNVAHNHTLVTGKRGMRTTIESPFGKAWRETRCESCGNCAQACPTGALSTEAQRSYRPSQTTRVRTTCPHCGVGCQLDLVVKEGRIVDAQGAPGPSNASRLCVKGRFASYDFVDAHDRIRTPLIKNHATGEFESATWDEALDLVSSRFSEIKQRQGGEAIAAFACSRSTNEDIYLFQKMARTALETNSIDCCARV